MPIAAARVLTAETDPIVRADLSLVLEDAGFSVCATARDGLEAVTLANEHKPDVVLLDLGLPRLDGVEATRRIVAEQDVPVVALSRSADNRVAAAVDAGAATCVIKPFAPAQLVAAVADAVARHEHPRTAELRAESRRALAVLCGALGYPEQWAELLERRAYARGRVWRVDHLG